MDQDIDSLVADWFALRPGRADGAVRATITGRRSPGRIAAELIPEFAAWLKGRGAEIDLASMPRLRAALERQVHRLVRLHGNDIEDELT